MFIIIIYVVQVSCKCSFDCRKISHQRRCDLFKQFYAQNGKIQGTYLMGLIHLSKIKRRRHGTYEEPQQSKRQLTINYTLPNDDSEFVRVCKKTFAETFAVTNKRLDILIGKKKLGETCYVDKRTNHKKSRYSPQDKNLVKAHINSIPRDESHYSRAKSSKQYLSPDLNINRLYKAFKQRHPDSIVTYKFYRSVFISEFPGLSFHRPRVDTCNVCDKLHCEIRANTPSRGSANTKLELHHRKAEKAQELLKKQLATSQEPGSDVCCLTMDLEQVLFVPTLTHSDMFYLSQLSCYNFGIHVGDIGKGYMFLWHEGVSGRGANEVASCLLHLLNKGLTYKRNLIIWSDNCAGQNKNKIILFTLIFLVSNGVFDSIEQRFLVSGHSFMPCDRDFALIEKRKRVVNAIVPNDLILIIESAKYTPPFEVINMTNIGFWDIKKAANAFLNTTQLKISKAVAIRIDKDNPTVVKSSEAFCDLAGWKETNILKKGQTLDGLRKIELNKLVAESKVSANKKRSLQSMMEFIQKEEHKAFYRTLLQE